MSDYLACKNNTNELQTRLAGKKAVDLRITKDFGYLVVPAPVLELPRQLRSQPLDERGYNMFLGGLPAYSRGTTFDPTRIAPKHRPASRKFQLDGSEVDRFDEEKSQSRFFGEIYRKQIP